MQAKELKKMYLDFFKNKGHAIIPSAPLIPENDPTALFTTAGMHPLVPFIIGQPHHLGKKIADVQKCLRTGDIDEVGDETHTTFFEMLGNWSLGDYFKKDAIAMSFEFLTKVLKIPLSHLAFTCFKGDADAPKDEEAANLWKSHGVKEERIAYLEKKDNWWGQWVKPALADLIQKCFIGLVQKNHQKYLIQIIKNGWKFGIMFLFNITRSLEQF